MSTLPPAANTLPASVGATRDWTATDQWLTGIDQALRTVLGVHHNHRPNPAGALPDTINNPAERQHIARLMRINHAGEVAAQALYAGQALTAKGAATHAAMVAAAQEETDHLAWCADRIKELGGRTSILNPLWYVGSFAIGALAGLAGDKTSLGFVAETEKQVGAHLDSHLQEIPSGDTRTRAIIERMRADEARHGQNALKAGANDLPLPIRALMKLTSKVMTKTAYRL